jgi:hypothetical protein
MTITFRPGPTIKGAVVERNARARRSPPVPGGEPVFAPGGRPANAIEQALRTPGPVLVEAVVDPFEPPMPPKVTARQAARFAESLLRGTPNREKIVTTVLSDKVRELV